MNYNADLTSRLPNDWFGQSRRRGNAPRALHMITDDGLVYSRPSFRSRFPATVLLRVTVGLALFKVLTVVNLGSGHYHDRIENWAGGTLAEMFAAAIVRADALTMIAYTQIRAFIHLGEGVSVTPPF